MWITTQFAGNLHLEHHSSVGAVNISGDLNVIPLVRRLMPHIAITDLIKIDDPKKFKFHAAR